jgi:peptidoglycan/xylan/chitin deacetylase (PgdA/CDA1 family)
MSSTPHPGFSAIPVLTYHQIAAAPAKGTAFRSLCVSPERFASQMRWLKRLGYQGLSMTELMPYILGERRGKVVGITFDDGYLNNLTHALPVLQSLGFGSTVYAVSSLLGQSNVWDHALGVEPSPLMNAQELRAWAQGGQEVGSHTQHHVHLRTLESGAALAEIEHSKTQLEQVLSSAVTQFCYPYGEFDAAHVAMVQGAGYLAATTTTRSRITQPLESMGLSRFELPRVSVVRSTHWIQFLMKICTSYEDRHLLQEELQA